ncbi:MAG TPA: tetratricopeptide repeat protein [Actinocrinis sp.]
MRFGLLGPVVVDRGPEGGGDVPGYWSEAPPGKPRAVLAVLLANANRAVPVERMVEALWGDGPPVSVVASLHNHVMRLRRWLGEEGGERIRAAERGYVIRVGRGELDADDFRALCERGRAALRDWEWKGASQAFGEALALWRGEPLAGTGLAGSPGADRLVSAWAHDLEELRLGALEGRIEADLELGRHRELTGELRRLTGEFPLRERLFAHLMVALYRSDRQAEALEVYQGLRRRLVAQLGVEPAPAVRDLQQRILNGDPDLAAAAPVPIPSSAAAPAAVSFPATASAQADATDAADAIPGLVRSTARRRGPRYQLPVDTRVFTGRSRELDELADFAAAAPLGNEAGMVVISAIDGMAGIGKTALAVHAAHRLRAEFPDGQLFLDLRGYAVDQEPLSAEDALEHLLRSLGTPPQLIPAALAERAALYRDRLDGTRTLIVLDNASGAAQVRPLLPGDPGCLVLVTSRRRLAGLDDARFLSLDTLPPDDAAALLRKAADPDRVPAHHPALAELAELCGRMPLALRIAAARLRQHRTLRIEDLVAELRDETVRLARLTTGRDRSLAAVFESSYLALPTAERFVFRSLGLLPGPDVDAHAAAALTETDHRTAERLLESLLDHNLLIQHAAGRYRFHDLVRAYAGSLAGDEPVARREAALGRLMDHYQRTARAADRLLARHTRPGLPAEPPGRADLPPRFSGQVSALTWLRGERANLLAAVAQAGATGEPPRIIGLAAALSSYLELEGPWHQAAVLHQAAADTANRRGDRLAAAAALSDLGRVRVAAGGYPAALAVHRRALAVYRSIGDWLGEANALGDIGRVHYFEDDYAQAMEFFAPALAIFRKIGDRLGEAYTLSDIGRVRLMTGDVAAAVDLHEQALAAYRELDHRFGEANVLTGLGRVRRQAGDFAQAAADLERALTAFRELGQRHAEAGALWDLGRVRWQTGALAEAISLQERALTIFQDLGVDSGEAYSLVELGRLHRLTGNGNIAAELSERAVQIFRVHGNHLGEANALQGLGRVRDASGDRAAAAELYDAALALFREVGDLQGQSETLHATAELVADTAGPHEALGLYRQAADLAHSVHSPLDEAWALEGLARSAARTGDRAAAATAQREAVAIHRRIGSRDADAAARTLAGYEEEPG